MSDNFDLGKRHRPNERSRDHSRPIRGQFPGHVITFSPSEASIQVWVSDALLIKLSVFCSADQREN